MALCHLGSNMSNTIRESQLRVLVKVLLEEKALGPSMIKVNPVVDPSAAVTDPMNPDYKPQSRQELQISLGALIADLADDNVPDIYDALKDALTKHEDKEGKEQMKKSNDRVEETIRAAVRKILAESGLFKEHYEKDPATGEMVWRGKGPAPKLAAMANVQKLDPSARGTVVGPQSPAGKSLKSTFKKMKDEDLDGPLASDAPAAGRTRRNKMQEGDKLKMLAQQFGFKNPNGVAQFITRTLERFRYNWENYDAVAIAMLEIMKDYVKDLAGGGDLAPADVRMLYDHPEHVMDLETFRVYSKKKLKEKGLMP